MFKRLKKNKKGLGFGNIIDVARSIASYLISIFPKPLLFVLFLATILLFGNLLNYFFYFNGVFCNSADQPVKIDSGIFDNIALLQEIPSLEAISGEVLSTNPSDNLLLKSCVAQVTIGNATVSNSNSAQQLSVFGVEKGDVIPINSKSYFFKGIYCTDCLNVEIDEYDGVDTRFNACYGDATRLSDEDKGFWARNYCDYTGLEDGGYCDIPLGYKYESLSGLFVCAEGDCQGRAVEIWNEKLESHNAKLIYPEINGNVIGAGYEDAIGVVCTDLHPRFAIYGIDIFDYRYWVLIAMIAVLLAVYEKYKRTT